MHIHLAEDARQRAADVVALTVLARFTLSEVDADLSRLPGLVATAVTAISPKELHGYSTRTWGQAARDIKIAFVKDYLANPPSRTDRPANRSARRAARSGKANAPPLQLPPPEVDEKIGQSLVAALYKFVAFREINPDWYVPHLEQMPDFQVFQR